MSLAILIAFLKEAKEELEKREGRRNRANVDKERKMTHGGGGVRGEGGCGEKERERSYHRAEKCPLLCSWQKPHFS